MNTTIMLERTAESSPRLQARIAGYLYLLIIIGGLFAPFAPPGSLPQSPCMFSVAPPS